MSIGKPNLSKTCELFFEHSPFRKYSEYPPAICLFHRLWLPLWTPKWTPNPASPILSTLKSDKKAACSYEQAAFLVRPMRFERTAFGVGVQRSIQLSYGRGYKKYYTSFPPVCKAPSAGFFFFGCRITIHVGQMNKKDEG